MSEETKNNGNSGVTSLVVPDNFQEIYSGLKKRELFAAMAMQGFITNTATDESLIAEFAVEQADALLAALEAKPHD